MKYNLCRQNKFSNSKLTKYISKSIKESLVTITLVFATYTCFIDLYSKLQIDYNETKYSYVLNEEKSIINQVLVLAKKLNINSPVELCSFTEQLLKNGDLSFNNKYNYNKNTSHFDIYGAESIDVIKGTGVCRHEAGLLLKVLKSNGYNAYNIYNNFNVGDEVSGHEYTLIVDNNNAYIYDITNSYILTLDGISKAISKDEEIIFNNKIYETFIKTKLNLKDLSIIYNAIYNSEKNISYDALLKEKKLGEEKYYQNKEQIDIFNKNIGQNKENIIESLTENKSKMLIK